MLERVLALSDTEVDDTLDRTLCLYGSRHRDLAATWDARWLVAHLVDDAASLSPARRRLVGATFSSEYALEAAALFNPSMVAHPDQSGLPTGAVRFVMTVRAVGEGHVSSVEFRTGTFDRDLVGFDDPGVLVEWAASSSRRPTDVRSSSSSSRSWRATTTRPRSWSPRCPRASGARSSTAP